MKKQRIFEFQELALELVCSNCESVFPLAKLDSKNFGLDGCPVCSGAWERDKLVSIINHHRNIEVLAGAEGFKIRGRLIEKK